MSRLIRHASTLRAQRVSDHHPLGVTSSATPASYTGALAWMA
jgi:hypothetical protein